MELTCEINYFTQLFSAMNKKDHMIVEDWGVGSVSDKLVRDSLFEEVTCDLRRGWKGEVRHVRFWRLRIPAEQVQRSCGSTVVGKFKEEEDQGAIPSWELAYPSLGTYAGPRVRAARQLETLGNV